VSKFKCNGCKRVTEFVWLDQTDSPDGFKVYQCLECCAVGTKNLAEAIDKDAKVSRCDSCGSWQFDGKPCYTCMLIDMK
jgi:hypothetical protein